MIAIAHKSVFTGVNSRPLYWTGKQWSLNRDKALLYRPKAAYAELAKLRMKHIHAYLERGFRR